MRVALAAAGVDDTVAVQAQELLELLERAGELAFPLIVKPARGVASKGVSRVDGRAQPPAAWRRARAATAGLDDRRVLAETFYAGQEYGVEFLSEDGRHLPVCVVAKRVDPSPAPRWGIFCRHRWPGTTGHASPTRQSPRWRRWACATAVTHTEVIAEEKTGVVLVIETHLRPAGDEIPYMVDDVLGIDLVDALARQSVGCGGLPEVISKLAANSGAQNRCSAIAYAVSHATGGIMEAGAADAALAAEGVLDARIERGPGERLDGLLDSGSRAHARAIASTPEIAIQRGADALRQLRFVVRIEVC